MSRPPMLDDIHLPGSKDGPDRQEVRRSSTELLPLRSGEDPEDGVDGLELDAQQSEEIRRIFATALPQYLIPVEEMVEQLLSGTGAADVGQALLGTIQSLCAAASRMGFDLVEHHLRDLAESIEQLLSQPGAAHREAREAILGALLDVKDLASSLGEQAGAPAMPIAESLVKVLSRPDASGRTILERLDQEEEGVGDLLPRLSAAGLVTLDQLRMARPSEIAAVSGLSLKLVQQLVDLAVPSGGTAKSLADSLPDDGTLEGGASGPGGATSLSPEGTGVLVLPTDPIRRQLVLKLRDQVESEAALDELRVEVHRLRSSASLQRRELSANQESCRALEAAIRRAADRLDEMQQLLERLRAERAALCQGVEEESRQLRQSEERLLALREERRCAVDEDSRMGKEVQSLVDRVGELLRQVQGTGEHRRGNE